MAGEEINPPRREAFLPLYYGDFLSSTGEWEGEAQSLYLSLLGYQWSLGSLPMDPKALCRLVRWDQKNFNKYWPQVAPKFLEEGGRLRNPRLEQHREKARATKQQQSEAGIKGAETRWGKHRGRDGDPNGDPNGKRHGDPNRVVNGVVTNPLWQPNQANPSHPKPSHSRPEGGGTPGKREVPERYLGTVRGDAPW
jgi:uncharacterized protein YdaU (DUF1376 family)